MRVPDLEDIIENHVEHACKNCGMSKENHESMFYRDYMGQTVVKYRCKIEGSTIARTLNSPYMRTYYFP